MALVDDLVRTKKMLEQQQLNVAALRGKRDAAQEELSRIRAEIVSHNIDPDDIAARIASLEGDLRQQSEEITKCLKVIDDNLSILF